ncbi:hypothetical protein FA95DRAFT_1560659 [Auriscalpium vulgare]|uniref:Uncharacterized protein n=1 Tax=Auriscalpium vulgare TaxID=40419 RepID=A0ACB8RQN1_9AGAM|nr:hypothetical protein FA95DRAFT_1560659 [Auriscalpium vulgare]
MASRPIMLAQCTDVTRPWPRLFNLLSVARLVSLLSNSTLTLIRKSRMVVDDLVGDVAALIMRVEDSHPEDEERHPIRDAGINRFPTELLIQIFLCCLQDKPLRDQRSSRLMLGWINITYVCQRWRDVALDCAHLWTHVSIGMGDAWVEEMLLRSGQKDLYLDDLNSHYSEWSVPEVRRKGLIKQNAYRVRSIDMNPIQPEDIIKAFDQPVPRLEHMHLRDSVDMGGNSVQILNAPKLRHLKLDGLAHRFSWTSSELHNLVTLHLSSKGQGLASTSVGEVIDALHGMPLLESLVLHYCVPHAAPGHASASHRAVKLARLRNCSIYGRLHAVAYLITVLCLPADVQLDLDLWMGDNLDVPTEPNALAPLISILTTYIHPGLRQLALRGPTGRVVQHPQLQLLAYRTDDTHDPDVKLKFTLMDQRFHTLFHFLSQSLPVAHIRRLSISLNPGAPFWTAILGRAVSLHEVTAYSQAGLSFCWALAHFDMPADAATGHRNTAITELILHNVEFSAKSAHTICSVQRIYPGGIYPATDESVAGYI